MLRRVLQAGETGGPANGSAPGTDGDVDGALERFFRFDLRGSVSGPLRPFFGGRFG
eukprot:COSAG01_NODE_782_length_13631_cov_73.763450_9_plen_56_part_00